MITHICVYTQTEFTAYIELELYVYRCINKHTQNIHGLLNIHIYTIVTVYGWLAYQSRCWEIGQVGLLPLAGCPKIDFYVWHAANTTHHYSWIRRITQQGQIWNKNKFWWLNFVGDLEIAYLFLIPKHYLHSQNGRKQMSFRKSWRKGQWNSWTRVMISMKLRLQPAVKLGILQEMAQKCPRKALKGLDPGFKFPIYWVLPQEVYTDLKIASVWAQGYTALQ